MNKQIVDEAVAIIASGNQDITSAWHQAALTKLFAGVKDKQALLANLLAYIKDCEADAWTQRDVDVLTEMLT